VFTRFLPDVPADRSTIQCLRRHGDPASREHAAAPRSPRPPAEIGWHRNGYLFIVGECGLSALRRNFGTQQQRGCRVEWLSPDELKGRFSSMNVDDLAAAVFSPDDGWLDPHSVLMGLRNKARSMGARFLADEVTGLVRQGHRVAAASLASGRVVQADHVVNAAGAWAKEICAMVGVEVRPEGTGYSGGVPTLAEPRGYSFGVDNDYFENAVWPALAHRFPKFERTKCLRTMPGLYDQNDFDGNAIVGPGAGGLGNFHMLAGFSGHGLMHAPGCGRAMAELLLTGSYQTIDLTRLGWQRLLDGTPLREQGII
jgi:FAD-dependent oxidoreductase domain-containing protein 1